jgi:hypothetical protein
MFIDCVKLMIGLTVAKYGPFLKKYNSFCLIESIQNMYRDRNVC